MIHNVIHKSLIAVTAIVWMVTALPVGGFAQESQERSSPTPLIAGVQVDVDTQTMTIMGLNLGGISGGSLALAQLTLMSTSPNTVTAMLPPYPAGTYLLALEQSDGTLSNLFYLTLGAVGVQGLPVQPVASHDTSAGDARFAGSVQADETATAAIDVPGAFPPFAFDHAGTNNIHFGNRSLESVTTGTFNTAIGANALRSLTAGSYNNAIGAHSLRSLTTGANNFALGTSALTALTTDVGNTAIGDFTLQSFTTGNYNTAVGALALNGLSSGQNNTAIGTGALRIATTGSSNIAIGSSAGAAVTAGDNNIHIGHPGDASDSNVIRIGAGQVGTYLAGTVHAPAFSGDGSALTGVTAVYQ